jgi:GNAT superfamily N-acetyltransferase
MDMIKIRKATINDAGTIAEFNQSMAMETEDKTLDAATIKAGVLRMVEDEQLGFYLIASSKDKIAGCLGITTEWSDWRNGLWWWIQSVYVDPDFRSQGIFSSLYKAVREKALNETDVCGIRLYAEKDNERAIRTYIRLGMIETEYRILEEEFSISSRIDT